MNFVIQKENIHNALNSVSKVISTRGIQPVLANILVETVDSETVKFSATDLDLSIEFEVQAEVEEEGAITLPGKKLVEIISKLPNRDITFNLNKENNTTVINCGNSKFDLIGISADEFPSINCPDVDDAIEIELKPLLKAVKQTVFAAAVYDNNNVLSGVFFKVGGKKLEMAATDGNRLSRVIENIENEGDKDCSVIIPSRTLNELSRLVSGCEDEKVSIIVQNNQILFKLSDRFMTSRILDGQYPKYQQLIPSETEKSAIVNREEFISALERTSTMVNERTSIIKLTFSDNKLLLKADTPDFGDSMDLIDVEYKYDELVIAFNYKYVLDTLRIIESENVKIDLNSSLSATLFRPANEDDYLCLIMPVQIR